MKAVVYTRVSTDEQARDGFSLAAQLNKCQEYIQGQGWTFVREYRDDGYSARNLNRPAMQRLIKDLETDAFDIIVVYKLDRLIRSVADIGTLLELFEKHKVTFASLSEHIDTTTAAGRWFLMQLASMAQYERENLGERVKMGKEQQVAQGLRSGGTAPYGYRLLSDGKLVVEPYEASIVRRIFETYLVKGAHRIRKEFEREDIRPANARKWSEHGIRYILDNPVYIGKIRHGYRNWLTKKDEYLIVDGGHEPIISEDLFYRVQELRKRRSELFQRKRSKSSTSQFVFSSVLQCARCGGRMYGNKRTIHRKKPRGKAPRETYRYYRCASHATYYTCDMPQIKEVEIEKEFLKYLDNLFDHDDLAAFSPPPDPSDHVKDRKKIKGELERIRTARKKWQIAFGAGAMELAELQTLVAESRKKERQLITMLEEMEETTPTRLTVEELKAAVSDVRSLWHDLSNEDKKQIIMELVEYIKIDAVEAEKRVRPNTPYKCKLVDIGFM